ncbi:hypothetical protein Curi_c14220 [Gottschalkia acidurici 9a]|uniref:Uncharacterized protein n=2 Tax=Clostridium acidurici TaxID=1556 RepID=K0B073_GOTA9|nr:hypothetical protein Curi_c14220 [Gottschalkia acidurici 9a]
MYTESVESLKKVELAINTLNDLEGDEAISGDEILNIIEPSTERLHELRIRLKLDINKCQEDRYSLKEDKADIFRKIAKGY